MLTVVLSDAQTDILTDVLTDVLIEVLTDVLTEAWCPSAAVYVENLQLELKVDTTLREAIVVGAFGKLLQAAPE